MVLQPCQVSDSLLQYIRTVDMACDWLIANPGMLITKLINKEAWIIHTDMKQAQKFKNQGEFNKHELQVSVF